MIDAISTVTSAITGATRSTGIVSSASSSEAVSPAGAVAPASFGDVLAEVSASAMSTLKASEATAISGIEGKASVQQVVEAIMSAEQTLQTAIAVRDKVVAAYQEVSRMAI